jgi:hypothetical protein
VSDNTKVFQVELDESDKKLGIFGPEISLSVAAPQIHWLGYDIFKIKQL